MASLARAAGARMASLLARQEGSLARLGQQTRGFAAGEACSVHGRHQEAGRGGGGCMSISEAACTPHSLARRGTPLPPFFRPTTAACCGPGAVTTSGGHGHHDSVTHAGLTIHKAASWHVWTGQAFAGVMWCVPW